MTIADLDIISTQLLAREDIADLRSTRDAIELADLLIWTAPDSIYTQITDHIILIGGDADLFIPNLREVLTSMILNPNE